MTKVYAWGLLLLGLTACPPTIDTGEDGGGTGPIVVGPNGGLFVRSGLAIDVPKGAVSDETIITVTVVDTGIPEVTDRKRISFGYRLSPTSLRFATPAKLYLSWLDDRVPRAVDPGTFDMRRQAGADAALALPGAKTSMLGDASFVEAPTERLGLFWVTSPSQPNVARLELEPEEVTIRVGETTQLTARVVSPTGDTVEAEVMWSAVAPRIGTVSSTGLFTATAPGIATVTARVGMQSAKAIVRVVGDSSGPSTFSHQNPFPTGNDLWGGTLAPGGLGTVFAGANGTVLTRSAADAWARLASSPGLVLKAVGGTTINNAVAVGAVGTDGVLVEFKGATTAPAVRTFRSVEPRQLWFDGTHGMAVGTGNDVLIYRAASTGVGRAWQTEGSPSFEELLDVIGDGQGRFVTVGARGSIYAWDPVRGVWDSLFQTQLATLLTAAVIATPSGSEVWAASPTNLWHFDQGQWTAENLPTITGLSTIAAMDLIDAHVVLAGHLAPAATVINPGLIITRRLGSAPDGGASPAWATFPMRNPQLPRGVFGGGVTSTEGYVVGDFGAVYRWDAPTASFVELSRGFYGDVADISVLANDVVATINECIDSTCRTRRGRVVHQGPNGTFEPLGAQSFSGPLFAVLARSPSDVIVSAATATWRYDGSVWAPLVVSAGGQGGAIFDFKQCGNTVWGVGEGGVSYRGSTTSLTNSGALLQQGDLFALWCPSENEVWAAGDGVLLARIGGAAWTPRTSSTVQHAGWRAVWAPGGGEAFAYGAAGYGVYWDTTDLIVQQGLGPVVPNAVLGLWGSKIDALYAVGYVTRPYAFGLAARFDGVQWALLDSGSQRRVTAIDGLTTDVWTGSEGGGLLRVVPPAP